MAEKFRFFDAVQDEFGQYDREYNAKEFTDYFKALVTTGVMKGAGNELRVTANGSNMITKVDTGIAFLLGRYYENDSFKDLTHDTETLGNSRIDRIVVRMDLSTDARYVKTFIKKGVPSNNPVAPPLTQTQQLYEISLAQVRVVGGQTYIAVNGVTDERGKEVICPWAGSNILPNFNDDELAQLVAQISELYEWQYGTTNIKIGQGATNNVGQTQQIAIGNNAKSVGAAIVMGSNAEAGTGSGIAIGNNAKTTTNGSWAVALGNQANAGGTYGIAIGNEASTTSQGAISIGTKASTTGQNGVSIGFEATGTGSTTTAIGANTFANSNATALGSSARANSAYSLSLGERSSADGQFAISIGALSTTMADFGLAIGNQVGVYAPRTAILGSNASGYAPSVWQIPGTLQVSGGKNFEMPHPNPEKSHTHVLRHGAVESPTAGDNLYRYTVEAMADGETVELELPDYFEHLNKDIDIWVNGDQHFGRGFGRVEGNILYVTCELTGTYKVLVIGTRNDNHEYVQQWDIKGAVREIGESWIGETTIFEVNEISEVTEIEEEKI